MKKITYLGPSMATFSALAYYRLAALFGAPKEGQEVLVRDNKDVLPAVIESGGYGAIAMETDAEGRVDGPVSTFLQLLGSYVVTSECPVAVIGAIRMPIQFALMFRPGIKRTDIRTVIAHPKSLGACKKVVGDLVHGGANVISLEAGNGQAAEDVATKTEFAQAASFGPKVAAEKYGLEVVDGFEACEDKPAVTTFFLLGPKNHLSDVVSRNNRALLAFRVKHQPGALVDVLIPFKEAQINVRHLPQHYIGGGQYDFGAEIECNGHGPEVLLRTVEEAKKYMLRHILFGPFPVV